jgi:small subunit ribosomal protein S4
MGNNVSIVKQSRRLGLALTSKAVRFMERRPYPPGEHGQSRRRSAKMSDYKRQLMEKQRLKAQYGLQERQLRNYVLRSTRARENREEAIVRALEARLDAVVLRAGFTRTIRAARQMVTHGHFLVNDKKINLPSTQLSPGDTVRVKPKSLTLPCFVEAREEMVGVPPAYLTRSRDDMLVKLNRLPTRAEVPVSCAVSLVIEYYKR